MNAYANPKQNRKHESVIVTGGSRGIGAAVSRVLGARGYPVAVNFINDETAAAAVVRDIVSAGGRAIAIRGNVGREEDILRLFETTERELGRIEGFNNAGVTGGFARVQDVTARALAEVLTINVAGAMLCAREAVRRMSRKERRDRWIHREYFFSRGPHRRGWRMGPLRSVERRHQQFHHWVGPRGCNRRHSRECGRSGPDRY